MIKESILNEITKRSQLVISSTADMLYYSNLHNKSPLEMAFPGVGTFKYLNRAEEDRSKKDYKEFTYTVNDIGFRDSYPAVSTKDLIGFFGCSITFGEGNPTEDNFPYQISKLYNKPHLNLGMPGASSQRIALIFQAAAQLWDMDIAVITLPNWGRFHYITSENLMASVVPPHYHGIPECEKVRTSLVKRFSDQYLMSATKDAVATIVSIAKQKNIKLILGSWDEETRQIIDASLNYQSAVFRYNHKIESARDNIHPGPIACAEYTNVVDIYIKENRYA